MKPSELKNRIVLIQTWINTPANEANPYYRDICDEFALIKANDQLMHYHLSNEGDDNALRLHSRQLFAEQPEKSRKVALLAATAQFYHEFDRMPKDDHEAEEYIHTTTINSYRQQKAQGLKAKRVLGALLGIPQEETEEPTDFCEHDEETLRKLQPSFDLINEYLKLWPPVEA